MDLLKKLKDQGWYLTEEGIKKLPENVEKSDVKKVIQAAMDMDFRDIAGGAVSSEISKKDENIPGKVVLQITKIRNISAPKANEESKVAPRFLQVEFTDGVIQIVGLEYEHISALSLNVPPGTKVYFKSETIPLMQNFLVLRPNDIQVLGGKVASLVEKWEITRTLQKYAKGGRIMTGTSGPPPWIPFGQKIQQNFGNDKNFKSLSAEKDKEGKENNEFEAMRSEAIAEAARAGGKKVFGGGNQQIVDHNVKKIMEKGYTDDEAKTALRATRNNLERALYNLKRRDEYKIKEDPRDKAKRTVKDPKKSKDDLAIATKPAGNVSLFDFLTDKLPIQTNEVNEKPSSSSKFDRISKSSSEPPKSINANNQTTYSQHQLSSSRENHFQSQHNQGTSIPSQMSRPKFENNISSSFANRNFSGAVDSDRGRGRNPRGGFNSNNYQGRQNDNCEKSRDNPRNSVNYSRNQKPHERNTNYQNSPSGSVVGGGGYESRNRNDYQQKNGYEKYVKGQPSAPSSRYQPKGESNAYQPNNRNYNENRPTSYNSDSSKINKITEETSKLKIDTKARSSGHPPNSRGQQNASTQQYHQQQHQQQKSLHQQSLSHPAQQHQQQQQQQKQHQQHTISHNTYAQLPNGFAYDPSKIMGFQNKETNEFAMTLLKSQAAIPSTISAQLPPVASHPQYAPPPMQIAQHPPYPTASFVMQQAHHQPPPSAAYGMNTGESWNWKIGDRCLAKYWDDGRYYEAEITGLSDKTCVVFYLGYGNHEEVLKSDCLPITDAQHRPINFSKMHEIHSQQSIPPPSHPNLARGVSTRYRGERQMYVPPPKRDA